MGELPKVFTADEVAETLRVPVRTVQAYVRTGKLRPLVLGKYVRFTEDAVLDFMRSGADAGADGFARLSEKGRRNAAARRRGAAEEEPELPDGETEELAPEEEEEEPEREAPEAAPAVPAHFSEAVREAETSARRNGWNVSALAARAISLYPEDPKLAEVVLVELTDRAALAEWTAEERRADAAGDSGEAKEARRRIHDMRRRQYAKPSRLEARFADALLEMHAERPEGLRPVPPRKAKA